MLRREVGELSFRRPVAAELCSHQDQAAAALLPRERVSSQMENSARVDFLSIIIQNQLIVALYRSSSLKH